MLQAERLLLKEALDDPLNQRFILLSDRCTVLHQKLQSVTRISPLLLLPASYSKFC